MPEALLGFLGGLGVVLTIYSIAYFAGLGWKHGRGSAMTFTVNNHPIVNTAAMRHPTEGVERPERSES